MSLPRRTDRRARMEKLRTFLDVEWTYFDALEKTDNLVDNVLHYVKRQRTVDANSTFVWPEFLDERAVAALFSGLNASYLTPDTFTNSDSDSLLCATDDNIVPLYPNKTSIPFHMILSRGMIACWYSHLRVLWHIFLEVQHIESDDDMWDGKEGVTIVLEDDVDTEADLKRRLEEMWSELPRAWDIVMLGAHIT